MAKYRATIETERGNEVSRLGRRNITTHTRGWGIGIKVECDHDGIRCYETGGSNNSSKKILIWERGIK